MTNPHTIELGTGILTWVGAERRTDRYGSIFLMEDGQTSLTPGDPTIKINRKAAALFDGVKGTLVATVIEKRQSTHIGDFFRGFFPETPEAGERITLGTGTGFIETERAKYAIGVRPDDSRPHDWLDPKALYRAHEQLVSLTFETESQP